MSTVALAPLIAIVDDEESVRKALSRLIRAAGFSVETYSSGADFLRTVEARPPHCVLLDLRMPQVSGFDVQRALKQANAQVPVVIITGDDSAESRADALRQGAKAYLRKPVDDAMLLDAIQTAIRSSPAVKT
jgi:FixJ family two-component response regulator